jgi:hypothetical protein
MSHYAIREPEEPTEENSTTDHTDENSGANNNLGGSDLASALQKMADL